MLIKICGLTRREDAEVAIAAGADLLGFVFVPGTRRAVTPAGVGWARSLRGADTVGVFRDASLDTVLAVRNALQLDWVQLHGEEPDEWLERLGSQVIRRVSVVDPIEWGRLARLARRCVPLVDPGAGDGVAWDWRCLAGRPPGLRLGIAGGLTAESVAAAVRFVRPALVDVSSGVERSPGVKDPEAVRAFVAAARGAEVVAD